MRILSKKYRATLAYLAFIVLLSKPPVLASDEGLDINVLFEASFEELMDMSFSTASKYQQNTGDAPSVSTIVTAEEIKRFGANSLYEIMERVTSVYMTGSNFFPQNVMAMRGTLLGHYDNHILLLMNGRPVRESYAGGVNFSIYNAFPVENIERLEIIRGPGSVLYGTNAYSGVVNIITKTEIDNGIRLSIGAGSFSANKVTLSGNYDDQEIASVQWGINYFDEKGWDFGAVDNNGNFGTKDFGEENLGVFVSAQIDQFDINAFYTRSDQDFIGASANWSGSPPINDRNMKSDRLFMDLGYTFAFSDSWYLNANVSYAEMEFDHYNYTASSEDTFFELTNHWQVHEALRWITGATIWEQEVSSAERLRAAPVPDFSSTWYSLYTQLEHQTTDELKLFAGAQLNKAENVDADIVPRLGAIYSFNQKAGLKLMYAEAFRAAFGVETGFSLILKNEDGTNRGGLRGNPSLNPETVKTTDFQLYYNDDDYQLSATLFHSKLGNLVSRERAADNVLDFINEGSIDSRGIELDAKINLNQQLHLVANYSYQVNENGKGIENFTTAPNSLFKAGFIYYLNGGHSVALFNNYVGEATDVAILNQSRAAVNPEADSYHLATANITLDLANLFKSDKFKDTSFKVYAYNLFNQSIHHPDFIGRRINTLPARSERAIYAQITVGF